MPIVQFFIDLYNVFDHGIKTGDPEFYEALPWILLILLAWVVVIGTVAVMFTMLYREFYPTIAECFRKTPTVRPHYYAPGLEPQPGDTVDTVDTAPPSQTAKTTWWTSVTGFFGPSKTAKTTSWNLSENALMVVVVGGIFVVNFVVEEFLYYSRKNTPSSKTNSKK
jgi:hypothetical protein